MPDQKSKPKKDRLKPLSLAPLKPEAALAAFMAVEPEKVRKAEKKERTNGALPKG